VIKECQETYKQFKRVTGGPEGIKEYRSFEKERMERNSGRWETKEEDWWAQVDQKRFVKCKLQVRAAGCYPIASSDPA
jgi:hypothetical protein